MASSKALDLLHRAMCAVLYWQTAAAINMATFLGVFVDCCLFACCPGGRWGDTERVVARWRRPLASGVALDMLHWAMHLVLHRLTTMAIKMANVVLEEKVPTELKVLLTLSGTLTSLLNTPLRSRPRLP